MCAANGDGVARRRRTHKETMQSGSSSSAHFDSSKIYAAEVSSSVDDDSIGPNKNRRIFRSSAARVVLAISSVALLIILLLNMRSSAGAPNIKDLSDTVMILTQQLGEDNENDDREALEHQLDELGIELSWERQHVEEEKTKQEMMHDSMSKEIIRERELIYETSKVASEASRKNSLAQRELYNERSENANLKEALANALEELHKARSQLPPAPDGNVEKKGEIGKTKRKLRATGYRPGDNIELIEYEEGGKVALHPGIVSDVLPDGTFNLVKLEQSILIKNVKKEQFQTYHVYKEGTSALLQIAKEDFVPVTIVNFLLGSSREGFELHGSYQITFDNEDDKERAQNNPLLEKGGIIKAQSIRMHRYVELGEIIGEGLPDKPRDLAGYFAQY